MVENIIAIESAIQSQVAEELATNFYRKFLSRMKLGLALQEAKIELVDNG